MGAPARKPPNVLTSTGQLSREEWLSFRRQGIGGSDAAAVLGISPFRTGVDLYYDKLGQPVDDNEDNWVAMEMGNLLEDLVVRIFARKTGLKITSMNRQSDRGPLDERTQEIHWLYHPISCLTKIVKSESCSERKPT